MSVVETSSPECLPDATDPLSLDSMSDTDLLEAWNRDHQRRALSTLIVRYTPLVLSVCRRRCRNRADADDAYQSTFLYLARNAGKIRHPERLAGWLLRVAQRASVATLPSDRREASAVIDPVVHPDDPLDRLAQRHEAIVLDEELADLPEHYRSAIVLHLYEGCSLQQLAEHFGTTLGSIRGRLQRGKRLLAQRLRRRGVVPVLAFATAHSFAPSSAQAAEASDALVQQLDHQSLPEPAIDISLLESLLAQGVRLMPALSTLVAAAGGSTLVLWLIMTQGTYGQPGQGLQTGPGSTGDSQLVLETAALPAEMSPFLAQTSQVLAQTSQATGRTEQASSRPTSPGKDKSVTQPTFTAPEPSSPQASGLEDSSAGYMSEDGAQRGATRSGMEGGDYGSMMGGAYGGEDPFVNLTTKPRAVRREAVSPVARQVEAKLNESVDLNIDGDLSQLPEALHSALGLPVLLDEFGIRLADLDPASRQVKIEATKLPLSTALRAALRPLGLQAIVESEGLVITADPAALAQKGIATSKWINIEPEAEEKITAALDQPTESLDMSDLPLTDALQALAAKAGLPLAIDHQALQEIGVDAREPINATFTNIKVRSALQLLLNQVGLTYTVTGEMLLITSKEAAEDRLLSRIYWLEGTGIALGDEPSLIESIQSSVEPDTWELIGGPSTIVPLNSVRPAIVVSTTYTTHETLENFIRVLRESHVGADPVLQDVPARAPQIWPGHGMGGMGASGGMM